MIKETVIYINKLVELKDYLDADTCSLTVKSNNGIKRGVEWQCEGCIEPTKNLEVRLKDLEDAIRESLEEAQSKITPDTNELYYWRIKLNAEDDFFGRGNDLGMLLKQSEESFTPADRELIKTVLRRINIAPNKR